MTAQLSDVLRDLADDRPSEGGVTRDAEAAHGAWTRSRQVRRRRRVAGAAVAVVAALLVVPVASSLSGLRAEQPLPGEVPEVAGVPDRLYLPPEVVPSATDGPGTPAALAFVTRTPQRIAGWAGDGQGTQINAAILVSATSDVYRGFPAWATFVALSPDGRRAAVVSGPTESGEASELSIVNLVDGSTVDNSWPGTSIYAAAFSPDGTQLAMSVGVPVEGSRSAQRGHVYVLAPDGTHDVAETFDLYGWLPGSREVVVGLGEDGGLHAVSAAGALGDPSTRLGPSVDAAPQGAVSMLSPDGLLLARAGVSSSTPDSSSFRLTVSRTADGSTVRQVDYPDVFGVQVLGWSDASTPVVAVWSNNDTPDGLLVVTAVGDQLTELSRGPAAGERLAAAQDLLSTVRPAGPPTGVPWYRDWRAAAWHVSGWFGMTPRGLLTLLVIIGIFAVPVLLFVREIRKGQASRTGGSIG